MFLFSQEFPFIRDFIFFYILFLVYLGFWRFIGLVSGYQILQISSILGEFAFQILFVLFLSDKEEVLGL